MGTSLMNLTTIIKDLFDEILYLNDKRGILEGGWLETGKALYIGGPVVWYRFQHLFYLLFHPR